MALTRLPCEKVLIYLSDLDVDFSVAYSQFKNVAATTKVYDRTKDEISRDEVEGIRFLRDD
jgi:hypothetical protein